MFVDEWEQNQLLGGNMEVLMYYVGYSSSFTSIEMHVNDADIIQEKEMALLQS